MAASASSSAAPQGVFVIFGASGAQGGSVARYAAQSGRFSEIRLATRDPKKESTQKFLSELQSVAGARTAVKVVQASFDDPASLDAALAGAQYSFGVTNWGELFYAQKPAGGGEASFPAAIKAAQIELQQARNWLAAVKKANLAFSIYSGLEDTRESGFKHVYHFHDKGVFEKEFLAGTTGAVVRLAFYLENFLGVMKPQNGKLALPFGAGLLPIISVAEFGAIVDGILAQVQAYGANYWNGQAVGLASDKITVAQLTEIWSRVTNSKVEYVDVPFEQYSKLGFPGDIEFAEMFQFLKLHETAGRRDVALTRAVATSRLSTAEEWLVKNAAALAKGN